MFHNILVAVDGSPHADRALDEAIDLAEAGNGRLTILTAIPRPPYWAASPVTAAGIDSLAGELEREAKTALRHATDKVPPSVPVTTILSEEPIREAIMHQVKTGKHDLLVMGSRGRGALSASVLGSVSHYALNHVGLPVLIIHAEDGNEPDQREPEEAEAPIAAEAQTAAVA